VDYSYYSTFYLVRHNWVKSSNTNGWTGKLGRIQRPINRAYAFHGHGSGF